jgi:hypothetical protein
MVSSSMVSVNAYSQTQRLGLSVLSLNSSVAMQLQQHLHGIRHDPLLRHLHYQSLHTGVFFWKAEVEESTLSFWKAEVEESTQHSAILIRCHRCLQSNRFPETSSFSLLSLSYPTPSKFQSGRLAL